MAGRIAGVMVGMFLGALASPAAAQSLADVARQEAARRDQLKATGKVLTNADLPASAVVAPAGGAVPDKGADESTASDAKAPAEGGTPAASAARTLAAGDATTAAAKAPTDDEDGWRARAERVNTALAGARAQVRQLKALSDRLSLEVLATDRAAAARAETERGDLRTLIARAGEKQAAAQADREALEQEARASGVPPAWIQ